MTRSADTAKQTRAAGSKPTRARRASAPDLSGPIQRPFPGVRSIPARTIQRAVKALFRERAAHPEV